jgi:hypothetical protein
MFIAAMRIKRYLSGVLITAFFYKSGIDFLEEGSGSGMRSTNILFPGITFSPFPKQILME